MKMIHKPASRAVAGANIDTPMYVTLDKEDYKQLSVNMENY